MKRIICKRCKRVLASYKCRRCKRTICKNCYSYHGLCIDCYTKLKHI